MTKNSKEGGNDLFVFKPCGIWQIYPDPEAEAIFPRWWHKLMFWKKWKYQEWKVRREYKKLSDLVDEFNGKIFNKLIDKNWLLSHLSKQQEEV